jgi:hypothetical protein
LFPGVGSNISSIPTIALSGQQQQQRRRQQQQQEQQQLLQNTVRDNTPGPSECADNLRNPSLINDILGTIGDSSSVDTNNVILLNGGTSHYIPDNEEGRVARASVLLENGDNSSDNSTTVSMERSGVKAVNTSVGGVFFKTEPPDAGAESGGAVGTSGGISKITGSNGKYKFRSVDMLKYHVLECDAV